MLHTLRNIIVVFSNRTGKSDTVIVDWGAIGCLGEISGVPARLGLKAPALAWPEAALASSNLRPGQSRHSRLGPGLAWLRPRLLYVK